MHDTRIGTADTGLGPLASCELDVVMATVGLYRGTESRLVDTFEVELAGYLGMASSVAVASDSGAVSVLLGALGVEPDDAIILSPAAPIWLVFAVLHAGVRPVFLDFSPDGLTIDAAAVQAAVTSRTRAVIASPPWGYPADLSRLATAVRGADLPLVVDLSRTLGTRYEGRNLLEHADIGLLSMQDGQRAISTGEGGAILFRDRALASRAKSYARFSDLDGLNLGINQKLSEPQAALASRRLDVFPRRLERQQAAALAFEAVLTTAGVETLAGSGRNGTFVIARAGAALAALDVDVSSLPLVIDTTPCSAFRVACPAARSVARELRAVACHASGGL